MPTSSMKHRGLFQSPWTRRNQETFSVEKRNRNTIATIGPIPSVMHDLSGILDTIARPSFLREDEITAFLKSQIISLSTATRIHDPNKQLHIVGFLKSYVHVGPLTRLLSFMMCERFAVPFVLGRDLCD